MIEDNREIPVFSSAELGELVHDSLPVFVAIFISPGAMGAI